MKYLACSAVLLAASPTFAGQPISVSMAECAGITLAVSSYVHTPYRKERILSISHAWAKAAADEAGQDMSSVVSDKADQWREKGRMVAFTEEFHDWTKYCGSLARHKGLKLVPES